MFLFQSDQLLFGTDGSGKADAENAQANEIDGRCGDKGCSADQQIAHKRCGYGRISDQISDKQQDGERDGGQKQQLCKACEEGTAADLGRRADEGTEQNGGTRPETEGVAECGGTDVKRLTEAAKYIDYHFSNISSNFLRRILSFPS